MLLRAAQNIFRPTLARSFRPLTAVGGLHTLPDLPYFYDALEPFISKEIMNLHHKKHHQAYVNGLNAAEESYAKSQSAKERIALQPSLRFNGGGHINHSLFWTNLAPVSTGGGELGAGGLKTAIERDFGSLEELKRRFNTETAAIQGSGWGWLGLNKSLKKLEIVTTPNQDPLLSHIPIIGVDIWEHAFYLQYQNVKVDYLNAIWHVINFQEAEKRLKEAL
ncbi:manganese superoxide dismutase [Cantharellus anzutake]|uniref:manganese superoxide dismutase n=1 Tax=Cantharellus anzutake TaxID=1750568 RepID=UPI0019083F0D|nr:manganese superoxide dismutase [Cantharellus anzutake]KAF8343147.1 manganese superoxide dismutase [Cantharellus anzutake]